MENISIFTELHENEMRDINGGWLLQLATIISMTIALGDIAEDFGRAVGSALR